MIIDDFVRDEQNEVWAICGDQKVHLDASYLAINKPQVGDEIAQAEPEVVQEVVIEEPVVEQPAEQLVIKEVVNEEPQE
jgi:hypothetical protein